MTLVGACKAAARPVVWLLRSLLHGMTIVGLSMHGRPYQEADADREDPADRKPAPVPLPTPRISEAARRTPSRDDLASGARLTPDELLWQAELEQRSLE